jgi:hypothetical protein
VQGIGTEDEAAQCREFAQRTRQLSAENWHRGRGSSVQRICTEDEAAQCGDWGTEWTKYRIGGRYMKEEKDDVEEEEENDDIHF